MNITQLNDFIAVVETGSFTEAASLYYASRSTLSKHIKDLELELGAPLFARSTRKVRVSELGELFLPYAKKIVALKERSINDLNRSLAIEQGTLVLGSIHALTQYKIIDILVHFKKSYPVYNVSVLHGGGRELRNMLRERKCELAFIQGTDEVDDDLVSIPYAEDRVVAVIPAEHALAGRKLIPLRLLKDENYLLIENRSMLYRLCMSACEQSGFTPKVTYVDTRYDNLVGLVGNGMGVTLMMHALALYYQTPEVAILNMSPSIVTHVNLCYLKNAELSTAARKFIECTKSQ